MASDTDYVIGRLQEPNTFRVTKFVGDAPKNSYTVKFVPATGYGRCDCPAGMYRHTGSADKHVLMVKKWLEAGN